MRGRGIVTAFGIALAFGLLASLAPAAIATSHTDDGRSSIDNWDTSFCLEAKVWFGALRSPTLSAHEDARITVIRYVEDSVTQGSEVLSLTRRGAPPVHGGRAIRATIERGFASARARFELAIGIAKKLPTGTDPTFAARLPSINRRIQQGLDRTIETLKSARGHSGNNAFDRAILANHYCDYIDELTSSTGSTA